MVDDLARLSCVSVGALLAVLTASFGVTGSSLPHKKKRAISWPFAIRTARLLTAWLRYRSVVVVGLSRSLPTIPECLCSF
ncbi:hypothetical protein IEQ34_023306 [Dendrobium chrysotoxum]|uniref:Secreted protein n=1 Tax=Dendrobium chrysotoxum TaxID=161865 RepID=A0AAV7FJM7_DENCH|nr:hypothetical protein IEQ34_025963 [Dendrobium chrysotoxum]KAH0440142.1 hypothetical protein IEQ34_025689 [Dendrobium chrysotoxum]KAH0445423.1 hypothetical protein IEQ34_025487 [Dendrobium chrysotoxum]KAH0445427.1 hypothetical protein IEQ34_025491 [Dendrobium chrysotoxum]KAH0445539.1 hypothetical protein IEQ34_025383 [Dendrobium chrysotoxum]